MPIPPENTNAVYSFVGHLAHRHFKLIPLSVCGIEIMSL